MFRLMVSPIALMLGFPRIRGDVPLTLRRLQLFRRFSPHTRGCSAHHRKHQALPHVFPAYAGMFRIARSSLSISGRFPRIRGDVPRPAPWPATLSKFSPHTRGCSARETACQARVSVFPAYAGMFRFLALAQILALSFPRIRGDVPRPPLSGAANIRFSPHTRGCSAKGLPNLIAPVVFPAYAGMFRTWWHRQLESASFPRIRGDVPAAISR